MAKIAIIGGGYTGLTAAYELSKNGNHEISIFEASSDLGGLAGGLKMHGQNIEKVYHHIFSSDKEIIDLANEIGVGKKLKWYPSSVCIYFNNQIQPFVGALDLLKLKGISLISKIKTGLAMFYLSKVKNGLKYEKISAAEWMKKHCGKSAFKVIWEPLLKGKFDKYWQDISMTWLWARLHIRANSRKNLLDKEMLGYFEGGFDVFTNALIHKIQEKNVKIETNSKVLEILPQENGSLKIQINDKIEQFDKVIFTIPSNNFADILEKTVKNEQYIQKLRSINYLGAHCYIFSSKQDLSKYYWHNINDLDKKFLVFIQHTNLINKQNYENHHIYYLGKYLPHDHKYFEMDSGEILGEWFTDLQKIFPDFDEKQIVQSHYFKFKNAQHIVDQGYREKIPEYKTPVKNVFLANFSQIYPQDRGTNYAVSEGRKIAKII